MTLPDGNITAVAVRLTGCEGTESKEYMFVCSCMFIRIVLYSVYNTIAAIQNLQLFLVQVYTEREQICTLCTRNS